VKPFTACPEAAEGFHVSRKTPRSPQDPKSPNRLAAKYPKTAVTQRSKQHPERNHPLSIMAIIIKTMSLSQKYSDFNVVKWHLFDEQMKSKK
jgi:hypothetical protein